MKNTTFIYGLIDPKNNHVRYVGKTNNTKYRLTKHIKDATQTSNFGKNHKCDWIRTLLKNNLLPEIIIIDEVPKDNWQFWEKHYIKLYREYEKAWGYNLTNATEGGDGISNMSLELKNKIRNSKLGQKHSEETKRKMKESRKEMGKGRKLSQCYRKNLGIAIKNSQKHIQSQRNRAFNKVENLNDIMKKIIEYLKINEKLNRSFLKKEFNFLSDNQLRTVLNFMKRNKIIKFNDNNKARVLGFYELIGKDKL